MRSLRLHLSPGVTPGTDEQGPRAPLIGVTAIEDDVRGSIKIGGVVWRVRV